MKRLLFAFVLFPTIAHADRLGSLNSSAEVLLTTQAVSSSSMSVYPATSTASFPFGLSGSTIAITSSMTVTGSGTFGPADISTSTFPSGIQVANIEVQQAIIGTRTTSIGWTVQAAANVACSTTCTSACVVGFDVGTLGVALAHIVNCSDGTADECLCAGPN